MSHEGYHEPIAELTDETRDMHRAIVSLMEELEAVDWYNQRMDACKDPELCGGPHPLDSKTAGLRYNPTGFTLARSAAH